MLLSRSLLRISHLRSKGKESNVVRIAITKKALISIQMCMECIHRGMNKLEMKKNMNMKKKNKMNMIEGSLIYLYS
jgi:hypothetical protein